MNMSQRTRTGLTILASGLAVGILGDALLRPKPWGLNIFLWTTVLAIVLVLLGNRDPEAAAPQRNWLAATAVLCAAAFTWHDSPTLTLLNGLGMLVSFGLMALPTQERPFRLAGLIEYGVEAAAAGLYALCGFPLLLFGDIEWKEVAHGGGWRRAIAVVRGVLLALPLLFIFGGLLMAADAVFEGIVNRVLYEYFNNLFSHLFVIGCCCWLVAGLLRGIFVGKELVIRKVTRPQALALGGVETGVVLGLLDLLFLGFIIVQFRYFFGGAALLGAYTKLTYAEYARRGFFELVTVTALVLPLLLVMEWLLHKDNPGQLRLFRWLAGLQVILLFVIMSSALQRMRLYQGEFGLTELRLYTTAFMGWLAVVFAWFVVTVLPGKRERFAFGMLVTGFLAIAVLHVLNPDEFITRTNLARVVAGRSFDAKYATSLSADAAPALIGGLPSLSPQDRSFTAARILKRWTPPEHTDWRNWNRSRRRAWSQVRENREALTELAGYHHSRLVDFPIGSAPPPQSN
jgi:hypothetical protein